MCARTCACVCVVCIGGRVHLPMQADVEARGSHQGVFLSLELVSARLVGQQALGSACLLYPVLALQVYSAMAWCYGSAGVRTQVLKLLQQHLHTVSPLQSRDYQHHSHVC